MVEKRTIIAVVGMAGAGKTSACNFLEKHGFTVLRFGDQTDIGLKEQGLSLTEKNERKYRENLREQLGMAAYAIKMKPRIEKALEEDDKIALDGLYSWEEYTYLKKHFKDLILLCVYARPEVRHTRLHKRVVRGLVKKEAERRDITELVNLNKGAPIAMADYLVENNGPMKDFNKKMNFFLEFLQNNRKKRKTSVSEYVSKMRDQRARRWKLSL